MNLTLSIKDFLLIASSDGAASCATLTKYPDVVESIETLDPDKEEVVIVREFGNVYAYSIDEYIDQQRRWKELDKWLEQQRNKPSNILQSTMDKVMALDPELAEMLRKQNM